MRLCRVKTVKSFSIKSWKYFPLKINVEYNGIQINIRSLRLSSDLNFLFCIQIHHQVHIKPSRELYFQFRWKLAIEVTSVGIAPYSYIIYLCIEANTFSFCFIVSVLCVRWRCSEEQDRIQPGTSDLQPHVLLLENCLPTFFGCLDRIYGEDW